MSHVAVVDIEIKDLGDLDAACKRLGMELIRDQKSYKWYGHWMNDYSAEDAGYLNGVKPEDYGKCEHAIKCPGAHYEVGVIKRPDGKPGYTLIWDFVDSHLMQTLGGKTAPKLRQAYAIAAGTRTMKAQGFRVQEKQVANGKVQLVGSK